MRLSKQLVEEREQIARADFIKGMSADRVQDHLRQLHGVRMSPPRLAEIEADVARLAAVAVRPEVETVRPKAIPPIVRGRRGTRALEVDLDDPAVQAAITEHAKNGLGRVIDLPPLPCVTAADFEALADVSKEVAETGREVDTLRVELALDDGSSGHAPCPQCGITTPCDCLVSDSCPSCGATIEEGVCRPGCECGGCSQEG